LGRVQGFIGKGSRIQGFEGSRVQGFIGKGSRVRGFEGSRFRVQGVEV